MHLIISIFSKPQQSQGRLFDRSLLMKLQLKESATNGATQSSLGLNWAHSLIFNGGGLRRPEIQPQPAEGAGAEEIV